MGLAPTDLASNRPRIPRGLAPRTRRGDTFTLALLPLLGLPSVSLWLAGAAPGCAPDRTKATRCACCSGIRPPPNSAPASASAMAPTIALAPAALVAALSAFTEPRAAVVGTILRSGLVAILAEGRVARLPRFESAAAALLAAEPAAAIVLAAAALALLAAAGVVAALVAAAEAATLLAAAVAAATLLAAATVAAAAALL